MVSGPASELGSQTHQMLSKLDKDASILLHCLESPLGAPLVTGPQHLVLPVLVFDARHCIQRRPVAVSTLATQRCTSALAPGAYILIDANGQRRHHSPRALDRLIAVPDVVREGEGGARDTGSAGRGEEQHSPRSRASVRIAASAAASPRKASRRSNMSSRGRRQEWSDPRQLMSASRTWRVPGRQTSRQSGNDGRVHSQKRLAARAISRRVSQVVSPAGVCLSSTSGGGHWSRGFHDPSVRTAGVEMPISPAGASNGRREKLGRFHEIINFSGSRQRDSPGRPPWPDRLGVGAGPRGAAEWADLICRVDLGIAGVPGG